MAGLPRARTLAFTVEGPIAARGRRACAIACRLLAEHRARPSRLRLQHGAGGRGHGRGAEPPSSWVRSATAAGSSSRTPRPSSSTWSSSWGSRRSLRPRGRFRDRHDATRGSERSASHQPDHVIEDGMTTYPGLPGPIVCDYLTREQRARRAVYALGTEFQIGMVTICANTGTYVDSPFHRYPNGIDLLRAAARSPRGARCGRGRCARRQDKRATRALFRAPRRLRPRRPRPDRLAPPLAGHRRTLSRPSVPDRRGRGVPRHGEGTLLVGIDSLNIDDTSDGSRPVHSTLLAAGDPDLRAPGRPLRPTRGRLSLGAVPAPIKGMGTFPVRAYATFD